MHLSDDRTNPRARDTTARANTSVSLDALNEAGAPTPIAELVRGLAAASTLEQVTTLIRHSVRRLVRADGATFVLLEGDRVHYVDEDAIGPLWKGQRFPVDACISGWSILNKASVCIPDIADDDRIPYELYRNTFVRSLAMAPIRRSDPFGAVGAYWERENTPTEREVALLEAIADATSLAFRALGLGPGPHINRAQTQPAASAGGAPDRRMLPLIAHELRNHLAPVRGLARLLEEHSDVSPGEQNEIIERLRGAADLLGMTLDDLVALGPLDTHEEPAPMPFDLVDATEAAAEIFSSLGPVRVAVENDAGPISALGNPLRNRQVLFNLLRNAAQASPDDEPVTVLLRADGPEIVVTVADRGPGVPAEQLPRLFELVHGIGLYVARKLVEGQGGRIRYRDRDGGGAEFSYTLPAAPDARARQG